MRFPCRNMPRRLTFNPIVKHSEFACPQDRKPCEPSPSPARPTHFWCFSPSSNRASYLFHLARCLLTSPEQIVIISSERAEMIWKRQAAKRGKCIRVGKLDWPTFRRNSPRRRYNSGVNELAVVGAMASDSCATSGTGAATRVFQIVIWGRTFSEYDFICGFIVVITIVVSLSIRPDGISCFSLLHILPVITNIQKHNSLCSPRKFPNHTKKRKTFSLIRLKGRWLKLLFIVWQNFLWSARHLTKAAVASLIVWVSVTISRQEVWVSLSRSPLIN